MYKYNKKSGRQQDRYTQITKQEVMAMITATTGCNPKGNQTCCPAHDDKAPSLSVGEGEDGRILLKCYAGCTIEAICAALDIQVKDLFPKKRNGAYRG